MPEAVPSFYRSDPIQYLQQLRIVKSMRLLTGTEKNITDIALECGFSGVSYFIETFRRLNGITPLQYRKRGSEQNNRIITKASFRDCTSRRKTLSFYFFFNPEKSDLTAL